MTKAKAKGPTLSEFRPQAVNANLHTERGLDLLEKSVQKDGWIGAMTVAADNEVFDGSARLEKVAEVFGVETEPIIIESDGTRPVIVKRTDIPDANDPRFKRLSIAANRIAQVDLDFDPAILAQLALDDTLVDDPNDKVLAGLFTDGELRVELGELYPGQGDAPGLADFAEQWLIIITCQNEADQVGLLKRFTAEGLQCRALVS